MKFVVLQGDGMADEPIAELGGKTPLDARATALLLQGRLVPELGQPRVRDDDVTDGVGRDRKDLADIDQLSDDRGFNLVLLDMSMPVLTGLQAAAKIRRLVPDTKILIVTMHDSPQMEIEARAAGADAYVTKMAATKSLLETMRALVANSNHSNGSRSQLSI